MFSQCKYCARLAPCMPEGESLNCYFNVHSPYDGNSLSKYDLSQIPVMASTVTLSRQKSVTFKTLSPGGSSSPIDLLLCSGPRQQDHACFTSDPSHWPRPCPCCLPQNIPAVFQASVALLRTCDNPLWRPLLLPQLPPWSSDIQTMSLFLFIRCNFHRNI